MNDGFCSSARHSAICVEKQTNQNNSLFDSNFPVMNSFLFSTGLKGNIESFRDTYRFMKCHSCFWKHKAVSSTSNPEKTTRIDYVNKYASVLQTTSYMILPTKTTCQATAGVVKPHMVFPKNASQHAADLAVLENHGDFKDQIAQKKIDCIRVDGASDENPGHDESAISMDVNQPTLRYSRVLMKSNLRNRFDVCFHVCPRPKLLNVR